MGKEEHGTSRRDFFIQLTNVAVLSVTQPLIAGASSAAGSEDGSVLATLEIKENPPLDKLGGSVLIKKTPAGDLLLVRSGENQYNAFSIICPHLKCNVKVKSPTLIQCPCHQSGYTIQGDYISGPAKKGLNKFPVSVEAGVIKIMKV